MAGIDRNFIHCGIRTQDIEVINQLAEANQINKEWLMDEIFKIYHEQKVTNVELSDSVVEKIINKALNKVKGE